VYNESVDEGRPDAMNMLRIHQFTLFGQTSTGQPPVHGVFARHGGVSLPPCDSLNVGFGGGDDPDRVRENRRRIKAALGLPVLVAARQVHGDRVGVVETAPDVDTELAECDALVSDRPGVGLLIQQADCQAILLHDPARQAVANIHSGWRGSVQNIIAKTVALMVARYGCRPENLRAAISPSLGPCCAEFVNYRRELPASFQAHRQGVHHFDFWAISRAQLREAGVRPEHIETAAICTRCQSDYFSYRREGITGRHASVIAVDTLPEAI